MRRTRGVLAAVLVLVCLGCGADDGAPGAAPRTGQLSDELVALEDRLQADHERWAGSVHQLQAAAVIHAYVSQSSRSDCLDEAGLPFEASPGWEAYIRPVDPPAWQGSGLPVSPQRRDSHERQVNAWVGRMDSVVDHRHYDPAFEDVYDSCPYDAKAGAEDALGARVSPPVVGRLHEAWAEARRSALEGLPTEQDLMTCIVERDTTPPFTGGKGTSAEARYAQLEELAPEWAEVPVEGEEPSAAWLDYLAAEQVFLDDMWSCQADSYAEAVGRVAEVNAEFAVEHADDIDKAQGQWAQLEADAAEVGWSPERPLAGFPLVRLERS